MHIIKQADFFLLLASAANNKKAQQRFMSLSLDAVPEECHDIFLMSKEVGFKSVLASNVAGTNRGDMIVEGIEKFANDMQTEPITNLILSFNEACEPGFIISALIHEQQDYFILTIHQPSLLVNKSSALLVVAVIPRKEKDAKLEEIIKGTSADEVLNIRVYNDEDINYFDDEVISLCRMEYGVSVLWTFVPGEPSPPHNETMH